jgi:hypothetical protein
MRRATVMLATTVLTIGTAVGACSSSSSTSPPASDLPRATTTSAAVDTTVAATTTIAATTTTAAPTLERQILVRMEGAQLDVIGPAPAPISTTMFLHHGTWAAEVLWESQDRWCLAKTFKLSITDAKSETNFGLHYDLVDTNSDCFDPGDPGGPVLVFNVTAARQADSRTVYDGTYIVPFVVPATRTVCSAQWDAVDPCGYKLTGLGPLTPTGS